MSADVEKAETVEIEWRGLTLVLPSSIEDCDVSVLEAIEDNKVARVVRGLLGDKQWSEIRSAQLATVGDLGDLAEIIVKALGFTSSGE